MAEPVGTRSLETCCKVSFTHTKKGELSAKLRKKLRKEVSFFQIGRSRHGDHDARGILREIVYNGTTPSIFAQTTTDNQKNLRHNTTLNTYIYSKHKNRACEIFIFYSHPTFMTTTIYIHDIYLCLWNQFSEYAFRVSRSTY